MRGIAAAGHLAIRMRGLQPRARRRPTGRPGPVRPGVGEQRHPPLRGRAPPPCPTCLQHVAVPATAEEGWGAARPCVASPFWPCTPRRRVAGPPLRHLAAGHPLCSDERREKERKKMFDSMTYRSHMLGNTKGMGKSICNLSSRNCERVSCTVIKGKGENQFAEDALRWCLDPKFMD